MRGNAIHPAAGLELPGPAEETELVDSALEGRAFPALEARVIAVVLLAAVVGEEDHDGVVGQLELVEFRQQPAHVVVDVLDHGIDPGEIIRVVVRSHGVPVLGELGGAEVFAPVIAAIFVRHLVRRVRAVEGEIDEERPIAFLLDELHGGRR